MQKKKQKFTTFLQDGRIVIGETKFLLGFLLTSFENPTPKINHGDYDNINRYERLESAGWPQITSQLDEHCRLKTLGRSKICVGEETCSAL
jgi:hypothetical protein